MKRVFICSPHRPPQNLRGHEWYVVAEYNVEFTRKLCKQVIDEGNAPFAAHLIYPQFLDDSCEVDRNAGIRAGIAFLSVCDEMLVGGDHISGGMKQEIETAEKLGIPIKYQEMK